MRFPKPAKHIKTKKVKKIKKSTLKRKADLVFSKYIRSKYGYCQLAGKDKIHCGGSLQTMHIETRGILAIRYNENNVLCGCQGHHVYYTYHPNLWRDFIVKFFPKKWEYVVKHMNDHVEMNEEEYRKIINKYEN